MLVLGPVVHEQHEPGAREALHQAIEEGLGLRVDPVEILEDDEERLDLALPEQETLHGVQRSVVALRGLERLPPRILHRHVQEREEGRDSRLEGWIERQHLAGQLLPDLPGIVARIDLAVGPEELDQRQVGHAAAVGD